MDGYVIPAARGADLFIAEAYHDDKIVECHLEPEGTGRTLARKSTPSGWR